MAALTEEQTMLKEQAKAWAGDEAPVSKFREMRDSGNEFGFDKNTWASISEMGWSGILVPDAFGGADMGYQTFGVVLEELGRQLTASPLLASGLVGASALIAGGNEAQKKTWLPRIAEGSAVVSLAVDDDALQEEIVRQAALSRRSLQQLEQMFARFRKAENVVAAGRSSRARVQNVERIRSQVASILAELDERKGGAG